MERAEVKKPAEVGRLVVQLQDVEMLVIARYGDGYGISTLGARYSSPPTCGQVVKAGLAWIRAMDAQDLGLAESIHEDAGVEAAIQLRALLDSMGSSLFMKGEMPLAYKVPGKGRWVFHPE